MGLKKKSRGLQSLDSEEKTHEMVAEVEGVTEIKQKKVLLHFQYLQNGLFIH
jgi:hypothetical protein